MKNVFIFRIIIITIICFVLLGLICRKHEIKSYAQIELDPTCPGILVNPQGLRVAGWRKESGDKQLTFAIEPALEGDTGFENSFTNDERVAIRHAFDLWTVESKSTCIPANFTETQTFTPFTPTYTVSYVAVHFGGSPKEGHTAALNFEYFNGKPANPYNLVAGADIYFEKSQFDRSAPSFVNNNMMLKVFLHEIGHTFGLDDVGKNDRIKLRAVMNVYDPDDINDSQGYMCSSFQPTLSQHTCDRDSINTINPQCNPPPPPPPGTVASTGGTCTNYLENFSDAEPCPAGFTSDSTGYY